MSDLISRQAAIDALDEQIRQCDKALSAFDISMKDAYAVKIERASLAAFRETLEYMPSAQPEIVRCKDCKLFGNSEQLPSAQPEVIYCGECKHMMPNGKCRQFADSTIRPSASDFCSAGERKDNG